jgi:hypothetical protein
MDDLNVTACLVTRGNVAMTEILASIPKPWDVVLWDNSMEVANLLVYGRYAAIEHACTDVVYVQDDDCILEPSSFRKLYNAYKPGVLTANMPGPFRAHYTDSCLLGFGAIFDKDLPAKAFAVLDGHPADFHRTCDVYFTTLSRKQQWLDLGYRNLPWADGDDRMYRQADHVRSRAKALEHARRLR